MNGTLLVVTHREWVADDLRPGAAAIGWDIKHDNGFDVPVVDGPTAWWMPTEFAAAMLRSGHDLTLAAPGPRWLSTVPTELSGRTVTTSTLSQLERETISGAPVFAKLAEMKDERLPAQVWPDVQSLLGSARSAGAPDETHIQVTGTVLDLHAEFRVVVNTGVARTCVPYLVDGVTWNEGMSHPATGAALQFAAVVLEATPHPDSFTLDVGVTRAGDWVVVEANPVWSSATYDADPETVVAALIEATRPGRWTWAPDPWLMARARRRRPLATRSLS